MRLDELSFEMRFERRTTRYSSSRCMVRLVPVFILETRNQGELQMFAQVCPDG